MLKFLRNFLNLNDLTFYNSIKKQRIAKEVLALNQLEKLTLLRTHFKKIPCEFCKMKNLKELTIESFNLDSVLIAPDCIFEMKNLKILTVKGELNKVEKFYNNYKSRNPNIQIKIIPF